MAAKIHITHIKDPKTGKIGYFKDEEARDAISGIRIDENGHLVLGS